MVTFIWNCIFFFNVFIEASSVINLSHSIGPLRGECLPQVLKLLHTQDENRTLNNYLR